MSTVDLDSWLIGWILTRAGIGMAITLHIASAPRKHLVGQSSRFTPSPVARSSDGSKPRTRTASRRNEPGRRRRDLEDAATARMRQPQGCAHADASCRLSPSASRKASRPPYLPSPRIGVPRASMWTRNWWVRPGLRCQGHPGGSAARHCRGPGNRSPPACRPPRGQRPAPHGRRRPCRAAGRWFRPRGWAWPTTMAQ